MSALRLSRAWSLWAVLCSISAFAVADANPMVFVIGVPAACVAWLVTGGSPARALPRAVINILLFVVVAWSSMSLFREGLGVSLFSEFVATLMVVKLLDRRSARDAAQILTLSAFLMIGAVLTSNSFATGLFLLIYLPILIAAVLWHQLARIEEQTESPASDAAEARRRTRRGTAVIGAAALAIAIPVFVLMPREIGSTTLGEWGAAAVGRVVGFNDEVKLGTGGLISESQEPVLDLEIFDRDSEPVGQIGRPFYLRGAVLDTYDPEAGSWVRGADPGDRLELGPEPLTRPELTAVGGGRPSDWSIRQEITVRNAVGERGHLFSIWRPNQVRVDPPAQLQYCRADGSLRVASPQGRVTYTVHSNDQEPAPESPGEFTPGDIGSIMFTDMPEVRAVAETVLRDKGIEPDPFLRAAADDLQAVSNLRNHFTAGGFRYTLDTVSAPPGRDPIEWFLTENKEGHCEYFASALAAMCRTVGINARVVTGYVATEYNPTTQSYIVRASNAHAWVEAEVLPGYWRQFDPTPPADLARIHEPPHGLLAGLRRVMDTMEFAWIRTVVGYDADARTELLGRRGAKVSVFPLLDRLGRMAETTRDSPETLLIEAGRNALVVFSGVLLIGVMYLRERARIWRWIATLLRRLASLLVPGLRPAPPSPAETLHAELLRLYRRAGAEKPDWVPLLSHTQSLDRMGLLTGPAARAATRLTGLLYAVLFRDEAPEDDRIRMAKDDMATVRAWAASRSRRPNKPRPGPRPN
ncbi:MAG: DUF3488 domain-containing protein [Phycisphaeraceae bacterium]|nr:MAG: DUF3488 domain-containing protein [Phycisphaeraceae bacterium]